MAGGAILGPVGCGLVVPTGHCGAVVHCRRMDSPLNAVVWADRRVGGGAGAEDPKFQAIPEHYKKIQRKRHATRAGGQTKAHFQFWSKRLTCENCSKYLQNSIVPSFFLMIFFGSLSLAFSFAGSALIPRRKPPFSPLVGCRQPRQWPAVRWRRIP